MDGWMDGLGKKVDEDREKMRWMRISDEMDEWRIREWMSVDDLRRGGFEPVSIRWLAW